MSMKSGASARFEPGSWQEAAHDIYTGTVVGAAHNFYFLKKWVVESLRSNGSEEDGSEIDALRKAVIDNPSEQTLRVLGAGFGRTGTYSLTLALEELGIPTLHTQHLYENEEIFKMWTDKIFTPSLEKKHAELGTPDFDVITRNGFQATTDLPMALYFEQIHEKYPDCKFILTTRESSQVWFRSWDTLTKSITGPTHFGGMFITGVRQYSIYLRWLFALVNKDDSFLTSARPKMEQDPQEAIASYEAHNARIREIIPPSQLLEYNVKQGWEPLCEFLEITDCPTNPFPKTNSARSVQVQAVSAAVTPLICVMFCLCYIFAGVFQRATGRTVSQWIQYQFQIIFPRFLRKVFKMPAPDASAKRRKSDSSHSLRTMATSSSSSLSQH